MQSLFEAKRNWEADSNPGTVRAYARELKRSGVESLDLSEYSDELLLREFWPNVMWEEIPVIDIMNQADSKLGYTELGQGNLVFFAYDQYRFIAAWDYDNRVGHFWKAFFFEKATGEVRPLSACFCTTNYFFGIAGSYADLGQHCPNMIELFSD